MTQREEAVQRVVDELEESEELGFEGVINYTNDLRVVVDLARKQLRGR